MKICLVALLIYCFSVSYSQVSNRPDSLKANYKPSTWVDFGIGWSTRSLGIYTSINIELKKHWLLNLSYDNSISPPMTPPIPLPLPPVYELGVDAVAFSFKIGRIGKGPHGIISWSSGISYVATTEYTGNSLFPDVKNKNTIGFALDAKLLLSGRFFGVGLVPYANINPVQSYMGLTICISVGRLKVLKD